MTDRGFVYGVYHPCAPANSIETRRVKIGFSKYDPWRDHQDGRIEKLNNSLLAFGFLPVLNAFEPIPVEGKLAETELKRRLTEKGCAVDRQKRGKLSEIYDVKLDELHAMLANLES